MAAAKDAKEAEALVFLDGVFAVVFSANAIFFNFGCLSPGRGCCVVSLPSCLHYVLRHRLIVLVSIRGSSLQPFHAKMGVGMRCRTPCAGPSVCFPSSLSVPPRGHVTYIKGESSPVQVCVFVNVVVVFVICWGGAWSATGQASSMYKTRATILKYRVRGLRTHRSAWGLVFFACHAG